MQNLTILGSTGSIGASTLDVVARHPDKFRVVALTANSQIDLMFRQCVQFKPRYAVMLDEDAAVQLRRRVREAGLTTEILSGAAALEQISVLPEVDTVMAAITVSTSGSTAICSNAAVPLSTSIARPASRTRSRNCAAASSSSNTA